MHFTRTRTQNYIFYEGPARLLRHDIVLLVKTAGQSAGNLLRGEGQSEGADGTDSMVDLTHGGILTYGCQEDVPRFIGHRNLMEVEVGEASEQSGVIQCIFYVFQ